MAALMRSNAEAEARCWRNLAEAQRHLEAYQEQNRRDAKPVVDALLDALAAPGPLREQPAVMSLLDDDYRAAVEVQRRRDAFEVIEGGDQSAA